MNILNHFNTDFPSVLALNQVHFLALYSPGHHIETHITHIILNFGMFTSHIRIELKLR